MTVSTAIAELAAALRPFSSRDGDGEARENCTFRGEAFAGIEDAVRGLFRWGKAYPDLEDLTVSLDGAPVRDEETLDSLVDVDYAPGTWKVVVGKRPLVEQHLPEGTSPILFLTRQGFVAWANRLSAFVGDERNEMARTHAHWITCPELESGEAFGGPRLWVSRPDAPPPDDWPRETQLPSPNEIRQLVHVVVDALIDPGAFLLEGDSADCELAAPFRKLSGQSLCAGLVNEYHGTDRVVLSGPPRVERELCSPSDEAPPLAILEQLATALRWAYHTDAETRLLLLGARLALDTPEGMSLLAGTCQYLPQALTQAKEQYRFVVRENRDAYARELRDLLGDLHRQTDVFSSKLRAVSTALMRDLLAGLFLLTVGMFAKADWSPEALASPAAGILAKALAGYFVLSIALQVLVHWRDVALTWKELLAWSSPARTHLTEDRIDVYLKEPARARRRSFFWVGGVLVLAYLLLAAAFWFFQPILVRLGVIPTP